MISPEEIFEEIVRATPQYNAESYQDSDKEFTKGIFDLFSRLGVEQGYTVKSNEGKYTIESKEFATIDMIWKKGERIVLALEHENDPRSDPIKEEWRKLVNVKADLKVLITYQSNLKMREAWVVKAVNLIKAVPQFPHERYLLVFGSVAKGKKDTDPYIRYFGYEFDYKGKVKSFRSPSVIPIKEALI